MATRPSKESSHKPDKQPGPTNASKWKLPPCRWKEVKEKVRDYWEVQRGANVDIMWHVELLSSHEDVYSLHAQFVDYRMLSQHQLLTRVTRGYGWTFEANIAWITLVPRGRDTMTQASCEEALF